MTDKPVTFTDCTGWAADALNAALRDAGKPAARDYITIAEQWMNLARMVPPSYPPAVPQQYLGYGYPQQQMYPPQYPQVPDFPPEEH